MLSPSTSLTASMNAIWMASPPPPFPTSFLDTAVRTLEGYSSGAARTQVQSPLPCCEDPLDLKSPTPLAFGSSPIFPSAWSLAAGLLSTSVHSQASLHAVGTNSIVDPILQSASIGVGLGLGFGLSVQCYPSVEACQSDETSTPATWGLTAIFSSLRDTFYSLLSSTPRAELATPDLTEILPHVFTSSALSPLMFGRPDPATPESTIPNSLKFDSVPVYTLPSPALPPSSNRRARCRPSPRRPRTCAAGGEIKSPILEYEISFGTTPTDRHGWNVVESFNASRRKTPVVAAPASHPPSPELSPLPDSWCEECRQDWDDCVCFQYGPPRIHGQDAPRPQLPWMRKPVHAAPYTPLPPSPALPSVISRSPRPENHHCTVNRYQSERVRLRLAPIVWSEPWGPRIERGTAEEKQAERRQVLAREAKAAKRAQRWWRV
ncbi:hypothetical protein C8R46DRAFT_1320014 [Mycena filopes]|nr:hypothetical protein C8R46DRAFT_1320014 [Mycena filopes]